MAEKHYDGTGLAANCRYDGQPIVVPAPNDSPLDVHGADGEMTICTRLRMAGLPAPGGKFVLASKGVSGSLQYRFSIQANGQISFETTSGYAQTQNTLTINQWHDIVLSYNANGGGASTVHIDVDGDDWSLYNNTCSPITQQPNTDVFIASPFNGEIDNLRIYDRELSAEEIAAMPTTSTDYDLAGNVTSTTDSLGNVTRYGYDALNRQTRVTDALGAYLGDPAHTTVTSYDAVGHVLAVTDPDDNTTSYAYDRLGRLTEEKRIDPTALVDPDGLVGYWKLDDGSGDQPLDSSGNGNNGSFAGTGPEWVEGKLGGGLKFDGTNQVRVTGVPVDMATGCQKHRQFLDEMGWRLWGSVLLGPLLQRLC